MMLGKNKIETYVSVQVEIGAAIDDLPIHLQRDCYHTHKMASRSEISNASSHQLGCSRSPQMLCIHLVCIT